MLHLKKLESSILLRIVTAFTGGYAFTWGFTALGISALVLMGMRYSQAHTLLMMLAFLVYLTLFLWAFATTRLVVCAIFLFGGGALMSSMAMLVQYQLI